MDGAALAKLLASPHKPTRDRAVRALSGWLSSNPADADLLKAWKGLFYCFWHCDGAAAQSALSAQLAVLLSDLPPPLSSRFLAAALATLRREWPGLDLLRLDKFYLLLRRLLRHALLHLRTHSWDPNLSAQLVTVLSENAFLPADYRAGGAAQGVAYHLAEVFLDELRDFLPLSTKTSEILLDPFIAVLEKSPDKVLVNKVKVNVFERLIENGAVLLSVLSAGDEAGEVEKFGKVGLLLGWSKKFFESASSEETIQGNRKVLFGLHHGFLKLEKDFEKSGLDLSLPELENGGSEKLVIDANKAEEMMGNGVRRLDVKPLKKRKKVKEALAMENSQEGDVHVENGDREPNGDASNKKKKKKKGDKDALDCVEEKRKTEKKKKKKKNKNNELNSVTEVVDAEPISDIDSVANVENVDVEVKEDDDLINFDESLMSNLQKQFEKVAAEAGMTNGFMSSSDLTPIQVAATVPKKRKRSKSLDGPVKFRSIDASGGSTVGKSGEKTAKKVRFSMKNNLVWKPHSPLPPESLRLPPSATPRGSALKKGVPPGPIKKPAWSAQTVKKVKV